MFKSIIKPTLVLMLICAVVSGLLAFTYNAAGVAELATAGLPAETLAESAPTALPGSTELVQAKVDLGDFPEVLAAYTDVGGAGSAFYVNVKGYHDGLKMLIGIASDGTVAGICVTENQETTGIGTKALKEDYLAKFVGLSGAESPADGVDVIGGATFSSKGVASGVNVALAVYEQVKEELAQ